MPAKYNISSTTKPRGVRLSIENDTAIAKIAEEKGLSYSQAIEYLLAVAYPNSFKFEQRKEGRPTKQNKTPR